MRPVKLTVQGFTCFKQRWEISFEGVDAFVICGPTGSGKSTIIDALCYALYGKIPRGTDIGDLISHDSDRMAVELEFEAMGERFRVHRGFNLQWARGRAVRTVSPVQLEHFDGHDWEGVGDRVKDVDAEVERVVGLDFRGFTRCVVLPQGRFQEFLAGDRKDRREILVELLDTGIYQRMMQAANAAAAVFKNDAEQLDRRLREEYADATEEQLAKTQQELRVQREALTHARVLRDAALEADRLAKQAAEAGRRRAERERQRTEKLTAIEAAERLVGEGEVELCARREQLLVKEQAAQAVRYDRTVHEALLRAEPVARQAVRLAKEATDAKTLAADTRKLVAARSAFAAAETVRSQADTAAREAEELHAQAQQHYAADFIRGKLVAGDLCPVCGNSVGILPATHRPDVAAAKKRMDDAKAAGKRAADAVQTAGVNMQREQTNHEHAVAQAEKLAADLTRSVAELGILVPQGVPSEHVGVSAELRRQQAARQQREVLEDEAKKLRAAIEEQATLIREASDGLTGLRAAVAALIEEMAAAQKDAEEARGQVRALAVQWEWSEVLAALETGEDPAPAAGRGLTRAQEEFEALVRAVERLTRDEERIAKAIVRAAELKVEADEKRKSEGLHRTLGTLLQANRFQDFVLEEAMQALVATASVHLQTLYPRFGLEVTKGEFAVVDHWHADQLRPARTLSGGETFVASLALALALAERLPELRQAAARALESLFLDEGFGMLDPETLETVIGALEGLRSQERMVGIITHVPELARRIESRVEVSKAPSGSTIALVGM